jgi:hypothetical protein
VNDLSQPRLGREHAPLLLSGVRPTQFDFSAILLSLREHPLYSSLEVKDLKALDDIVIEQL